MMLTFLDLCYDLILIFKYKHINKMKVIIIGGVAGGASCAARLRIELFVASPY